jgi:hypothetical protein
MSNYDYKGTLLSNIFQSGLTQFADYTNLGTPLQFSSIFPNLPTQTLGYANTINDIGAACCPRFVKYLVNSTHTCNAAATGVYLIVIGGGGGGGSGGSTSTYTGDGGGGGGGGGMLALKISKSNNPTITTPITIVINIGAKGDGGLKRTNHGAGLNGTSGGATTATILCSGNDIVGTAYGGGFGRGGENLNNGLVDATGGAGGSRGISLFGGTVNYSNDNSNNGSAGLGGQDGTGDDYDISAGGDGGLNGYTTKGFFLIEDSIRGNGGVGGDGNSLAPIIGRAFGSPGDDGRPGAVYVFEYFD